MVRNMILLVHDPCLWPRTHPGCPVTHQNVSRVLGKALKIFATIVTLKTIVHCKTHQNSTKIALFAREAVDTGQPGNEGFWLCVEIFLTKLNSSIHSREATVAKQRFY